MTEHDCPTEIELTRGFGEPDAELAKHVAGCPRCKAIWDSTAAAIDLARELPTDVPSAAHREEVRTAFLATVMPRATPRARSPWIVPFVALAAAAAVVFVVVRVRPAPAVESRPHARRGTVHAHDGASYALVADPPDEIVRLRTGTIDVDVHPLQHGERFRVIIGTDEIEVHGTSFEVVAEADQLRSVRVVHGLVHVRHHGQSPAFLTAGQSWTSPPPIVTPAPITPVPAPPPPTRVITAVAPHPTKHVVTQPAPAPEVAVIPAPPPSVATGSAADPQEVAFNTGWAAMRRGELQPAAEAFARAVALDPHGPLAEDGAFWHVVALARLGKKGEATVGLRSFIDEFSTSTRAGEASVMLGWLLVESGELEEARSRFDAATDDPSASVQKSAAAGLRALDARRR